MPLSAPITTASRHLAAVVDEGEGAVDPAALAHLDVGGQGVRIPVRRQVHRVAHCLSRFGLPSIGAPGGTCEVTTVPGVTCAPRPMETPFRMIAPMPTLTSSPISTGRDSTGGRLEGSPSGALATASLRRSSGSSGWKSPSEIAAFERDDDAVPDRGASGAHERSTDQDAVVADRQLGVRLEAEGRPGVDLDGVDDDQRVVTLRVEPPERLPAPLEVQIPLHADVGRERSGLPDRFAAQPATPARSRSSPRTTAASNCSSAIARAAWECSS